MSSKNLAIESGHNRNILRNKRIWEFCRSKTSRVYDTLKGYN